MPSQVIYMWLSHVIDRGVSVAVDTECRQSHDGGVSSCSA